MLRSRSCQRMSLISFEVSMESQEIWKYRDLFHGLEYTLLQPYTHFTNTLQEILTLSSPGGERGGIHPPFFYIAYCTHCKNFWSRFTLQIHTYVFMVFWDYFWVILIQFKEFRSTFPKLADTVFVIKKLCFFGWRGKKTY